MKGTFKYFIVGLVTLSMGFSQSLEETLKSMAEDNAKGYLGPMVSAFGMSINSGTFHTAKPHSLLGFDLKLGVSIAGAGDAGKTYDFVVPDADIPVPITIAGTTYTIDVNPDDVYESDREAYTMFGEATSNEIVVDETAATNLIADELANDLGVSAATVKSMYGGLISSAIGSNIPTIMTPEGLDIPAVAMIVPQFSLGLPMEIELTLRGMPALDLGDYGELTFFGFGGKIGLNQFIPIPNIALPRVAIGYYMTNLGVGDIMTMSNSIATLQVSKSIPFLTVYGGFGLESSSLDVDYTYKDEFSGTEVPVKFTADGDNSFRTTIGARLKLAVITINADYNVGEYNTVNVGVGLTLR